MKIAFTTAGRGLDAPMESHFGRSPRFLVFDTNTDTYDVVENEMNRDAPQGAGIQSAEKVIDAGAGYLVSGHCGPKAFRVLQAAGVVVYNTEAPSVARALDLFRAGDLSAATAPNSEGHL